LRRTFVASSLIMFIFFFFYVVFLSRMVAKRIKDKPELLAHSKGEQIAFFIPVAFYFAYGVHQLYHATKGLSMVFIIPESYYFLTMLFCFAIVLAIITKCNKLFVYANLIMLLVIMRYAQIPDATTFRHFVQVLGAIIFFIGVYNFLRFLKENPPPAPDSTPAP